MASDNGTTGPDALELLTSDHRTVDQLFTQLNAATADPETARQTAEEIISELSVHAVIEEMVLYPAVRQALPDGDDLAEEAIEEHQELKELLASVDGKPADDPDVRATFQTIQETLEHHVGEEEQELFPALRSSLDQEKLNQLGAAMDKAKGAAPTRPHPKAPSTPPGNLIAGLGAAVVDKVRDAARSAMRS